MAVFRGQGGSKKSKPRRTTTKKRDRPTVTKTKKEGAPDTSAPTAAELMSGGVDRGLAEGVVNKARKDAAVAADRATGKFSGMPASTTPSGFVDIGGGAGQIDRGLALAAGLVQGDPWVSTSGWTPDTGVAGTGITGIDTTVDGGKVDTTTDGDKTEKDKEEEKKFYIAKVGKVNKRLYDYYQGLLKRMDNEKAVERVKLKKMEDEWAEKNLQTLTERFSEKGPFGVPLGPLGILKGALQKQPYENEFLGSAGAAAILNKINKAGTEGEKQKIMHDAMAADPEGFKKMFSKIGDPNLKQFKDTLVNLNEGNKNFDKNYHETAGAYWELHPPQTSGAMEDMANAYQQGNLEMTKQNTLAIQNAVDAKSKGQGLASLGGGGGGGGGTQPVDPADPDAGLMPSGTYLASQYNQALVPDPNLDPYQNAMYTGGPEQQHLAGGYWDPDKQEWVGSPWGTQNLWQGANPPTTGVVGLAEGGPVRAPSSKVTIGGGGLFDFKPYGF